MKTIEGYKAYDGNFADRYGSVHFVGEILHVDGDVKAGPIGGNGFHLCLNFEDTFRYVDSENCILCKVIGFGKISDEYVDNYYGYDGIYACSDLYIEKIIIRDEIFEMALSLPEYRLERLIQTFVMSDDEILEIENHLSDESIQLKKTIAYYHYNQKDAYKKE